MPLPVDRLLTELGPRARILVIRLGALGDIVRTLPAVRLLRRALPESRIGWVLESHWSILLEGHPDIDEVVQVPRKALERTLRRPLAWPRLFGLLAGLRRELRAFDAGLVLDFHGNLRSGLVSAQSGARHRLGYAGHQQKEGNRRFNTHHVPSGDRRTPRMERNLDLIRALGVADSPLPSGGLGLVAPGQEDARAIVESTGATGQEWAVIAPGVSASQGYKKPPAPLLAAACRELAGRRILPWVVHGPGEEPDARRVVEVSDGAGRLAPPTSIPALTALIAGARLFVGGDTGPMHLACATGCPVVALYGPTDPRVNRPWGVRHRALSPPGRVYTGVKRQDREAGGFEGLGEADVVRALTELLDER